MTLTFAGYPAARNNAVSEFAILGAPCDLGTTGVAGQRMAPWAIRAAGEFDHDEFCDPETRYDWSKASVLDHGDVPIVMGDYNASLEEIANKVAKLAKRSKKLVVFGGDDGVNVAVLRGLAYGVEKPPLLIHLDAHSDTYAPTSTRRLDHGCWVSKALYEELASPVYQYGLRAPAPRTTTKKVARFTELDGLFASALQWGGNAWLAIDIDVVDPAYAPGTGFPEPGGMTSREILKLVEMFAPYVRGMSITEVLPGHDPNGLTAQLANRMTLQFIQYGGSPG